MLKIESLIEKLIVAFFVWIAGTMVHYVRDLSINIVSLNEKMGVIVSRIEYHERELNEYGKRILMIESKGRK